MGNNLVEITGLKKAFGDNVVLNNVNLTLNEAENLVVLGRSGSGKSVLIKCLVGLIKADFGEIHLFGENLYELSNEQLNILRKKIGFLFQSAALYDSMSVSENIEFPLRDDKLLSEKEKKELVLEALDSVGLKEALHLMPSELSGGMKKRVGLARTLILKPEIILYDEPTTGLDPITSKEISQLILDIQEKYKTASIIITHDMECARLTSNRMLVIKEGSIAHEGSFEALSESKDSWLHSFFNR